MLLVKFGQFCDDLFGNATSDDLGHGTVLGFGLLAQPRPRLGWQAHRQRPLGHATEGMVAICPGMLKDGADGGGGLRIGYVVAQMAQVYVHLN